MAYVTGTAADMAEVKTALTNACTANGWTETSDSAGETVLYNGGCYVQVIDGTSKFHLLGRTDVDSGDSPWAVSMRRIVDDIEFPVTYFAFVFASEVYFIINYLTDRYQFIAFGQSAQPGLPGTGNWIAASCGYTEYDYAQTDIANDSGGHNLRTSAALFWNTWTLSDSGYAENSLVHDGIDSTNPWTHPTVGPQYLTELLRSQPSKYTDEAILLPVKAYKNRPSDKVSQILELSYARHIRIEHYVPEQIMTLGTDEWMVFPYHRRNVTNPNPGNDTGHTGTFGWAIKK